jgi:hypothetical protein
MMCYPINVKHKTYPTEGKDWRVLLERIGPDATTSLQSCFLIGSMMKGDGIEPPLCPVQVPAAHSQHHCNRDESNDTRMNK